MGNVLSGEFIHFVGIRMLLQAGWNVVQWDVQLYTSGWAYGIQTHILNRYIYIYSMGLGHVEPRLRLVPSIWP